ncbi:MAG TPA: hypothetical protein VEE82_03775 [Thermodesulfovibrionales bacterium]|nr:hypothetical protein [Thermodesulfovibrionales bacterium]
MTFCLSTELEREEDTLCLSKIAPPKVSGFIVRFLDSEMSVVGKEDCRNHYGKEVKSTSISKAAAF